MVRWRESFGTSMTKLQKLVFRFGAEDLLTTTSTLTIWRCASRLHDGPRYALAEFIRACDSHWFGFFGFCFHLQVKLAEMESELLEVNANNEKLDRSKHELAELHTVLEKVTKINLQSLVC